MRICHVITRLIIGGAQENTILTCEGLHDRGHDVLLCAGPDGGPEGSLWNRAGNHGYQVQVIPSMHRKVRPLEDMRAIRQLCHAYSAFKPQIIHTHSSKAGIVGRQAAKSVPTAKVVHTIHGMSFNRTQPVWFQRLARRLEHHAALGTHKIVSVADAMTDQAVAAGIAPREKFVTIPSGMQTEWFTPDAEKRRACRREWGFEDDCVVTGTVARLFRNKGYEQLIPALAEAVERDPSLRFVWIGDGAQKQDYFDQLEQLGLQSRVVLTGLLTPEKVAEEMQGFDMLVHCSQWEGLPRTVVQALLLEVPAISFDNDGAPEVVKHRETGLLVPFNDVSALTEAILTLAADPQLRRQMGEQGRRSCIARFNHRIMTERLEQLYQELLKS